MLRNWIALAVALIPCNAMADVVVFNFTGTVTTVSPTLLSEFTVSESVSGSYTFNTAAVDQDSDPKLGVYELIAFNAIFGGDYAVTQGLDSEIVVGNDTNDFYDVFLNDPIAPAVAGQSAVFLVIGLIDTNATVFNSDAIPSVPPNLSAFEFDGSSLFFSGSPNSPSPSVSFQLTSISAVPESSAFLFCGLAAQPFLGIAWWNRRKRNAVVSSHQAVH